MRLALRMRWGEQVTSLAGGTGQNSDREIGPCQGPLMHSGNIFLTPIAAATILYVRALPRPCVPTACPLQLLPLFPLPMGGHRRLTSAGPSGDLGRCRQEVRSYATAVARRYPIDAKLGKPLPAAVNPPEHGLIEASRGGAFEVGGEDLLDKDHNEGGESWLNDAVLPLWT